MPNFILTKSSVILCSHGGFVTHMPMNAGAELINGQIPMVMNDQYLVVGCPNFAGGGSTSCARVTWLTGSLTKRVNGNPVLINTSTGICMSNAGVPTGPPIIASFQTAVTD